MQGRKISPGASGGDKFLLGGGGGSTQARAEDFQIGVAHLFLAFRCGAKELGVALRKFM